MGETINTRQGNMWIYYLIFLVVNVVLIFYYLSFTVIHFTTPRQFPVNSLIELPLSSLIFPAEMFSFLFGIYFVYTLLSNREEAIPPGSLEDKEGTSVALLLPVYNEPKDLVEKTVKACKKVRWPGEVNIYLLDDSTELEYEKKMEGIAKKHGCRLVRRDDREGYKAGNINNAVRKEVDEEYFTIFDADQAPEPDFLEKTMDYFSDPEISFVPTPQYFVNDSSPLERTSKIGANVFFQGMCQGRSKDKAMIFCGTNGVIKREVFEEVNGFSYYTSTEDIDIGIRMNSKGYHGAYVPEVLVYGEAPKNFDAYASQQYRWSNGNLAILRENWYNLLFGNFSFRQTIHHLFVLGWWLIGLVTMVYIATPMISLFTGLGTHHTWLPGVMIAWLYFNVALGIGIIYFALKNRMSRDKIRVRDAMLQYSLIVNSMFIYAKAAVNALFKKYTGFIRTSKEGSTSELSSIRWNLVLAAVCFVSSLYALFQGMRAVDIEGVRTFIPVSLWLLFYTLVLSSSIFFVGEYGEEEESSVSQPKTGEVPA